MNIMERREAGITRGLVGGSSRDRWLMACSTPSNLSEFHINATKLMLHLSEIVFGGMVASE